MYANNKCTTHTLILCFCIQLMLKEPEDVRYRSAEHLLEEEENEKAASDRKEDGEESRKTGRPPMMSRIPTFQSTLGRKRVTVQTAESSLKMDGSSQQGQKEKAGSTEAGRVKMFGGREKALPIPSARLPTSLADVLFQGDSSDHASSLSDAKLDQSLDQTLEDSDQADASLQRPPLRNVCETNDLVDEPVSEFETASVSEDEQMPTQNAVVEELSSCSSADQHKASDQAFEDALREEKGSVSQSLWAEENPVADNDVKHCFVSDKDDESTLSGQDETVKIQKPSDSKKCFKESKTADAPHTKHTQAKTCTHSKVR